MNLTDGYVPVHLFGKDHWSTLAYAESVMVDCGGFQVGFDGRMRQGRMHYRVMQEGCPRPKRPGRSALAVVMEPRFGSILSDGSAIEGHDDWHCIQDLAAAGFFDKDAESVEPGVILHLSETGRAVANNLRKHKADGNNFASFRAVEAGKSALNRSKRSGANQGLTPLEKRLFKALEECARALEVCNPDFHSPQELRSNPTLRAHKRTWERAMGLLRETQPAKS